jgi:hypothetical protein
MNINISHFIGFYTNINLDFTYFTSDFLLATTNITSD